ncbi:PA1571 family protein [Zestomonas thermotolerans]|jgi:hypothetical protein|uniref:PA1571 family protein n=1 Tax=Zestomonas thermotolerans TaxID=157784 RepID=UPI0003721069|nr:PA1571 family protein [Pseudomonas thermotolerans]
MSKRTASSGPDAASRPQDKDTGGAIIDAQGREIPITEQMVRRACRKLDKNSMGAPRERR